MGSRRPALMSVRNVITKLELIMGLAKVKGRFGAYVWKVRKTKNSHEVEYRIHASEEI